jgi:formylglycine-generating enzyme required for sulfatase activity
LQPSPEVLLEELENHKTTHQRRRQIGELLAKMGDPRPGVGLKDGLPNILWLPVAPGGKVEINRFWIPETPDDVARVIPFGTFDIEPFYIARYPVTYAQYQAFIDADDGFDNPAWWQGMPELYHNQKLAEQRTKQANNPRDSLSWYQCIAFTRWLNHKMGGFEIPHPSGDGFLRVGENTEVRLPVEGEWQWASQNGPEARPYPWGAKQAGYANTAESGLKQAIAVGMYPHGAAACGAQDMSGNLMEWCANDKADLEITDVRSTAVKALRGGDWGYSLDIANCSYADDEDPGRIDPLNGCRLVLGKRIMA